MTVFVISAIVEFSVLFYVIAILPESLRSKANEAASSSETLHNDISREANEESLWNLFKNSWSGSLDVLATPGRGRSVLVLSAVATVATVALSGYNIVFFFYPSNRFGWDSYDSGLFTFENSTVKLVYLTFVLPFLLKVLGPPTLTNVERIRLELGFMRYQVLLLLYFILFLFFHSELV